MLKSVAAAAIVAGRAGRRAVGVPVSVSRQCAAPVGVWAVRRAGRGGWALVFRRFVGFFRRFVGCPGAKRPAAPVRPAAQNRPASRPSRR